MYALLTDLRIPPGDSHLIMEAEAGRPGLTATTRFAGDKGA